MTSKEFIYNLAKDLGLKTLSKWANPETKKLMKFGRNGFLYTFVISDNSTSVGIWRFSDARSSNVENYRERCGVNLCDPDSIEKIRDFLLKDD